MNHAGSKWGVERTTYRDIVTGVTVHRLTGCLGHNHHLYFTNPGWYDRNRRLLFGSDRDNRRNLFSLELRRGEITQLTDLQPFRRGGRHSFLNTSVNPRKDEAYFWHGRVLWALDLKTCARRELACLPEGFCSGLTSVTADGKTILTTVQEDLSDRFPTDLARGYLGFREIFLAKPLCRILGIPADGSGLTVLHEDRCWIGHVNPSPTQAHLLTFCHEGPWTEVDCRIWGLDRRTGRIWRIRPRRKEGECVGHEYWLEDGETIGYHGHTAPPNPRPLLGFIRYDDTGRRERLLKRKSMHFHSRKGRLIAGDGWSDDPFLYLWRWWGGKLSGPRILLRHRSSFHIQEAHPHPCFTPDGKQVLFSSDDLDYVNVYLAEVPEFDSLPVPR